eukprot:12412177-Karenia_brevis.AAC.1
MSDMDISIRYNDAGSGLPAATQAQGLLLVTRVMSPTLQVCTGILSNVHAACQLCHQPVYEPIMCAGCV